MISIDFVAVLVAAFVAFIVGFLFHGPVFGKLWMKLADIHPTGNEKLSDMLPQLVWNLVTNIVTAILLSALYTIALNSTKIAEMGSLGGVLCALLAWGFIVASSSIEVIWMGRKLSLWLFECVSSLVVMTLMGTIIACW